MATQNAQKQQAWYWHWFWYDFDLWEHLRELTDPQQYRKQMYQLLDGNGINGFNIRITAVACLGFLASSYSLFATSIIWPALAFTYRNKWDAGNPINAGELFDQVTLAGIIFGMLLFGHLADRVGRKRLYGLELIIIIFATIGIVFSSNGYMVPSTLLPNFVNDNSLPDTTYQYESTMNIFTSVTTWRCLLGIGIGAEYPMSAIFAAEFVATQSRGTTIALVFLMQSIGRMLAFGLANAFLQSQYSRMSAEESNNDCNMGLAVDATWRFVAGFGGLFAVIAVTLRMTIPESPRYTATIDSDLQEAMTPIVTAGKIEANTNGCSAGAGQGQPPRKKSRTNTPWLRAAWRYFWRGGWRRLTMMCVIWFLLDVCFYGTGLDSPSTLSLLWLTEGFNATHNAALNPPSWENDPKFINQNIHSVLENDGVRALEVSFISSLAGSVLVIPLINFVPRKSLLISTSLALSVIFFITGGLVIATWARASSVASRVFYALAQFFFNLGPNTVVFVLPAEIFPTVFRGTFYGLAAASGKAGAMFVRHFVSMASQKGDANNRYPLVGMLFAFGGIMLLIAGLNEIWSSLPDIQQKPAPGTSLFERLTNNHLEDIATNPGPGTLAKPSSGAATNGQNGATTHSTQMDRLDPNGRRIDEPIIREEPILPAEPILGSDSNIPANQIGSVDSVRPPEPVLGERPQRALAPADLLFGQEWQGFGDSHTQH